MARLNIPEPNHTKIVSTPCPVSMQERKGVVGPKYTRVHHKAKRRSFPKSELMENGDSSEPESCGLDLTAV